MADTASEGQSFFDSPFNSARVQQRVLAATDHYHRSVALGTSNAADATPRDPTRVLVQNSLGTDLRRGDVIELGEFALDADNLQPSRFAFFAALPNLKRLAFAIALHPIVDGAAGECQLLGQCIAWVNITDADHQYAGLKDGEKVLQSASSGPVRILKKPTGTGEQECAVIIDPLRPQRGIAVVAGSDDLEACDLYTPGLGRLMDATSLPTRKAALYLPGIVSGDVAKFVLQTNEVDIYNPTPFVFSPGDSVWVRDVNGLWLVDRAEYIARVAKYTCALAIGTGSRFGTWTQVDNFGNLTSYSGNTLTISCPEKYRLWRLTWNASATISVTNSAANSWWYEFRWVLSGTTDTIRNYSITLPISGSVGSGGSPAHTHPFTAPASTVSAMQSVVGSAVVSLSKNDTLKIQAEASNSLGTALNHQFTATVHLEPLF